MSTEIMLPGNLLPGILLTPRRNELQSTFAWPTGPKIKCMVSYVIAVDDAQKLCARCDALHSEARMGSYGPMKDSILSANCLATIAELKTQIDTLDDVMNETSEQTAEKSVGLLVTIASIVLTPSVTLAECAAKASLYLAFNRDDIAMSLADDVVRLASG